MRHGIVGWGVQLNSNACDPPSFLSMASAPLGCEAIFGLGSVHAAANNAGVLHSLRPGHMKLSFTVPQHDSCVCVCGCVCVLYAATLTYSGSR